MKQTTETMIAIIKSEICNGKDAVAGPVALSEENAQKLYLLSKKHDVAHIVGNFVLKNRLQLPEETKKYFEKFTFQTLRRHELLCYELENLCELLEKLEIPHIPLKGSVIRHLYPEPWLRSSCDIDMLVPEIDAERVVSFLEKEHSFRRVRENTHDISTQSPRGISVEIHYALVEDGIANQSSDILSKVWEYSKNDKQNPFRYNMSDEMFYFYHIAHMAKHFENGGCGVRPFIDLWLLDRIDGADKIRRDKLLEEGGLLIFANAARKLSNSWFSGCEKDEITEQMEEFIIRGGSFGINTNRVNVQQQKKGGKIKYLLSKIFTPYKRIKHFYPILKKHKWLTPFMQVRRWFKLIFCGHLTRTTSEMKYNMNIDKKDAEFMKDFLKNIGL